MSFNENCFNWVEIHRINFRCNFVFNWKLIDQFGNFVNCYCRVGIFYHIRCMRDVTRAGNEFTSNCDCQKTFESIPFFINFTTYHRRIVVEIARIRNMPQENRPHELLNALLSELDLVHSVFPDERVQRPAARSPRPPPSLFFSGFESIFNFSFPNSIRSK